MSTPTHTSYQPPERSTSTTWEQYGRCKICGFHCDEIQVVIVWVVTPCGDMLGWRWHGHDLVYSLCYSSGLRTTRMNPREMGGDGCIAVDFPSLHVQHVFRVSYVHQIFLELEYLRTLHWHPFVHQIFLKMCLRSSVKLFLNLRL
jgi:hypothetical protein